MCLDSCISAETLLGITHSNFQFGKLNEVFNLETFFFLLKLFLHLLGVGMDLVGGIVEEVEN